LKLKNLFNKNLKIFDLQSDRSTPLFQKFPQQAALTLLMLLSEVE
jgi:hypothetical protein